MSYAALNFYSLPGSAISDEATSVARAASALLRDAENSQALFGTKTSSISQLRIMARECAEPNWDGYGASAVDPDALHNAESFLRALPAGVSLPEFSTEPDGSISLDWIRSRHRLFSVSVGSNNRLAYAWLDGSDKGHAVANFDGFNVPKRILSGIQSIMGQENVTLRAA